ncbi:MAG: type II-A CRISPR-associated protein Csn2 [Lachnospiraceae bacterium]|nr:type II-A CRISPR-associated protein Csn2 [Lachnospiraceae bacterium]
MKMTCDLFQEVIIVDEGCPVFLTIEKQDVLYALVKIIYSEINGNEGEMVFSEDSGIIKASKKVELITSFIPFELNEKRLINRIIAFMESVSLDEEHFNETMVMMSNIEKFVMELSESLSFDISCENISVASLLKMSGIIISDDSICEIEKIWNYVSAVNELLGEKFFIFVNMSAFFNEADMQLFVDLLIKHNCYVLFIENKEYPIIQGTKKLIIDRDLCII